MLKTLVIIMLIIATQSFGWKRFRSVDTVRANVKVAAPKGVFDTLNVTYFDSSYTVVCSLKYGESHVLSEKDAVVRAFPNLKLICISIPYMPGNIQGTVDSLFLEFSDTLPEPVYDADSTYPYFDIPIETAAGGASGWLTPYGDCRRWNVMTEVFAQIPVVNGGGVKQFQLVYVYK